MFRRLWKNWAKKRGYDLTTAKKPHIVLCGEPGYEYLMGYNSAMRSVAVTFQGVAKESYYAIVYFDAGKGNGSGGVCMGSSVIVAK